MSDEISCVNCTHRFSCRSLDEEPCLSCFNSDEYSGYEPAKNISILVPVNATNRDVFMNIFPDAVNEEQAKWFFGSDWWNTSYEGKEGVNE